MTSYAAAFRLLGFTILAALVGIPGFLFFAALTYGAALFPLYVFAVAAFAASTMVPLLAAHTLLWLPWAVAGWCREVVSRPGRREA